MSCRVNAKKEKVRGCPPNAVWYVVFMNRVVNVFDRMVVARNARAGKTLGNGGRLINPGTNYKH